MFDAYQNGGLVDGKPVTDERMRSYVAARRDGISQDDPLYDEWNNRLIQLDFRIGEEKITLAFQQGKVGAGAVASYYRSQLGKIPKDSAFYREVAGRAAQWAKSAAGAARGRARAGLEKALAGKQNAVAKTWGNYSRLEAIITEAARRAGLIAGSQTLTDADASRLLDLFGAGIVLPNGKNVTFEQWKQANVDAYNAFDQQIAINKQLKRGVKELTSQKGKFLDENLVRTNAIDDRAKYEAARDVWIEAVEDAQGDPAATKAANDKYAATLDTIMDHASKDEGLLANDPEFIGGLTNEINAVRDGKFTGPTVFDLQSTDGESVTTADAEDTAQRTTNLIADGKALDSGKAFYGQSEFGGPLGVIYYPPGAALDPFGRNGLGPDSQPAILTVNGKPTQVVLKGQPVESKGIVAPDGSAVTEVPGSLFGASGSIPVANLSASDIQALIAGGYTVQDGGVVGYVFQQGTKTTFGVVDPTTGDLKFTDSNPFGGAFIPGKDGFTVFTGSVFDNATGDTTVGAPPITLNLGNADSILVDPNVKPSDLRNAAKYEPDPEKQAAYLAAADKRAKLYGGTAEENAEMRLSQNAPSTPFLSGVGDFIRDALGAANQAAGKAAETAGPPTLKMVGDDRPIAPPPIASKPPPGVAPSLPSLSNVKPPLTPAEQEEKAENRDYKPPKPPKPPPPASSSLPGGKQLV